MSVFDPSLSKHGNQRLRTVAIDLASAGLRAADPALALTQQVYVDRGRLVVPGRHLNLAKYNSVWVVAAGKASGTLAAGVEELLGDWLTGGAVVVPHGMLVSLRRLQLIEAEHPVPGDGSFRAGVAMLDFARRVGPRDLVISSITGGSSALVVAPAPGVTVTDKRELHQKLLGSGADITEINTVRKHVSAIKGGRLAARMHPATILNLSVSDVAGDPAEFICDLTVQNTGRARDASDVLTRYDLWGEVPNSVRRVLSADPGARLPSLESIDIETLMLVTGETVCAAMLGRARQVGLPARVLGTGLSARADGVGALLAGLSRECSRANRPFEPPIALLACGGESVVELGDDGTLGSGGPNQEVALSAAIALRACDGVALLAMDTDGSDGGTDASGGLVDGTSMQRGEALGLDLRRLLRRHESRRGLDAIGDLIVTGRTHTNVNDLIVVVADGPSRRIERISASSGQPRVARGVMRTDTPEGLSR